MKRRAQIFAFVFCLLLPLRCKAQKLGQIECSRQEGYVYLYSSMATMEISTTLKCGQRVTVLDRSDNVLHVRTDTGEEGFVPLSNVGFFKPGTAPKSSAPVATKRELTHYDNPGRLPATSQPTASAQEILLKNQTAVHLKLGRELSSAAAHVGEEVNFEVSQDVVVNGVVVIAKGAPAVGAVTEAEPKKRGKGGKINASVASVLLANNEKIALRSFGIEQPADQKTGMSIPLMHGKDVTLAKDTEMTAYVDGDQHLRAASFAPAHSATQSASQSNAAQQQN
ncbi:MAG: hypothetical protein JWO71_243 [Candidatus Acidoferrum typicum]|nr:hypothetical protein [Candidatus Acidoferrum typicum]